MNSETEVKIAVESVAPFAQKLAGLGFVPHKPRHFEANTVFDTPDAALRATGQLLRVRQAAEQCVLTYKGPAVSSRHKTRDEIETEAANGANLCEILSRLGYVPAFRYEKYRTEFTDHTGIVTLDETPIGSFMELEGTPAWIDATAVLLGFDESRFITKSYGRLYLDYCAGRGLEPGNMTFAQPSGGV